MTYMNRDDRRASIVEAAAEIILKEGIGAATVRGVAKALDASPGHIHHHFASADALRAEAFRTLWRRLTSDLGARLSEMPPRERLVAALIGDDEDYEGALARLWNESLAASSAEPLLKAALGEAVQEWMDVLARAVEEGVKTGVFSADVQPAEVARNLASFSMGMDILAGLGLPNHSGNEMRARIKAAVDQQASRG
jgi:AcrR family transcriptional regulator